MATEIRFGIVIAAKDAATSVVRGIAAGAKSSFGTIADTAAKARSAMGGIFSNLANIKAGFDLVKEGAKVAVEGLSSLVSAALESRAEGDKQRRDWEAYKKSLAEVAQLLGGPLLTAILGVLDALQPVIASSKQWLKANQDTMASGILEWIFKVAQGLTTGIATAVITVTRIWNGWREVIGVVEIAVNAAFGAILSGAASVVGGLEDVARFLGQDGIAAQAQGAREALDGLGGEFAASADRALGETARIVAEQEALEAKVNQVAGAIETAIGQRAVVAFRRLGDEAKLASQAATFEFEAENEALLQEYLQNLRIRANNEEAAVAHRLGLLNRELEEYRRVEDAKRAASKARAEEIRADQEELASTISGYFGSIRSIAVSAFADIGLQADGTRKTVGDAFGQLFGGIGQMVADQVLEFVIGESIKRAAIALTAKQAVAANAANAASGAAASQAGIPVVGPVLAVAAMGAMLATVLALSGGFERGGVLGAGMAPSSRDNLIFAGAAGEGVLTTDTTQRIARDLSGRGGPGSSPTPPSPSRGGRAPTYVLKSLYPPSSRADIERMERDVVAPAARRMRRLGHEV